MSIEKELEAFDLKLDDADIKNGEKQLEVVKTRRKREIDRIVDDPTDALENKKPNHIIDEAVYNNPMWVNYRNKELGPDKVAHALLAARGNRTKAAHIANCSYQSILNYIREYPQVREVLHMCEEVRGDMFEKLAEEKALRGDSYMIWNVLKTKYKNRGYTETIEIQRVNTPTFKYQEVPPMDMTIDIVKEDTISDDDSILESKDDSQGELDI